MGDGNFGLFGKSEIGRMWYLHDLYGEGSPGVV
jgi:hypothetical protein